MSMSRMEGEYSGRADVQEGAVAPTAGPSQPSYRRHLPRLPSAAYRGQVLIHWTMAVDRRSGGWLDEHAHLQWREVLLHMCVRFALSVPVYCVMPDHVHLVTVGLGEASEHRLAVRFLRQHTVGMLRGRRWQHQCHDRVLRGHERRPGAFERVAWYILQNPSRAGLVGEGAEYPFSGCILTGYPSLTPFSGDFWEKYWRLLNREISQMDALKAKHAAEGGNPDE